MRQIGRRHWIVRGKRKINTYKCAENELTKLKRWHCWESLKENREMYTFQDVRGDKGAGNNLGVVTLCTSTNVGSNWSPEWMHVVWQEYSHVKDSSALHLWKMANPSSGQCVDVENMCRKSHQSFPSTVVYSLKTVSLQRVTKPASLSAVYNIPTSLFRCMQKPTFLFNSLYIIISMVSFGGAAAVVLQTTKFPIFYASVRISVLSSFPHHLI